jgi:hypothetical protein
MAQVESSNNDSEQREEIVPGRRFVRVGARFHRPTTAPLRGRGGGSVHVTRARCCRCPEDALLPTYTYDHLDGPTRPEDSEATGLPGDVALASARHARFGLWRCDNCGLFLSDSDVSEMDDQALKYKAQWVLRRIFSHEDDTDSSTCAVMTSLAEPNLSIAIDDHDDGDDDDNSDDNSDDDNSDDDNSDDAELEVAAAVAAVTEGGGSAHASGGSAHASGGSAHASGGSAHASGGDECVSESDGDQCESDGDESDEDEGFDQERIVHYWSCLLEKDCLDQDNRTETNIRDQIRMRIMNPTDFEWPHADDFESTDDEEDGSDDDEEDDSDDEEDDSDEEDAEDEEEVEGGGNAEVEKEVLDQMDQMDIS